MTGIESMKGRRNASALYSALLIAFPHYGYSQEASRWYEELVSDNEAVASCALAQRILSETDPPSDLANRDFFVGYLLGAADSLEGPYSNDPDIVHLLREISRKCETDIRQAVRDISSNLIDDLQSEFQDDLEDDYGRNEDRPSPYD